MEKIFLKTSKNNDICVYTYTDVENPKAIVLLVHGASEHLLRYDNFAKFLVSNGYIVIGSDNLGHGLSAKTLDYVHFEYKEANEAFKLVIDYIKENYPNLDLYLLGHSMGSFIARKLLIDFKDDFKKGVISGTTSMSLLLTKSAIALANINKTFCGNKHISKLLGSLALDNLPKQMIKDKLLDDPNAWITHDAEIVDYYKNSPMCGKPFTSLSYKAMFKWVDFVSNKKNIRKGNKETPILFIVGKEDPLSNYSEMVFKTKDMYLKEGYKDVNVIAYDNMRHEVLNEIDKDKVYKDVLEFFNK